MALGETCSQSQESVFSLRKGGRSLHTLQFTLFTHYTDSSRSRQIWQIICFTCYGTLSCRGSGDLHIPEVEVLIKSLIKKEKTNKEKQQQQKQKRHSGTPRSTLKKAASPYGKREFIVSTVMLFTVSWCKQH